MKKMIFSVLAVLLLVLMFSSSGVQATIGTELLDYRTGFKILTPSGPTTKLTWELEICCYSLYYAQVTISYRGTSPSRYDGAFDITGYEPDTVHGGYILPQSAIVKDLVTDPPLPPGECPGETVGVWHGAAIFDSWVDTTNKATNHGEITIWWPGTDIMFQWSFNVQHNH